MNSFFKRLPLQAKLMLLTLLPLVLLVYFAIEIYIEKTRKIEVLEMYINRVEQSVTIGSLIAKLQAERRYSYGYSISKGWQRELNEIRRETNNAISEVVEIDELMSSTRYTMLDSLGRYRALVDKNMLTAAEVMEYYTDIIFRLNTLNIVTAANISYLDPVRGDLASQKILSELVTHMGIIRAKIYSSLFTGQDPQATRYNIRSHYKIYSSYERELYEKASPGAIAAYNNLLEQTDLKETMDYIRHLYAGEDQNVQYIAEDWWQVSERGVEEIRSLQKKYSDISRNGISRIHADELSYRNRSLIFILIMTVVVIMIMFYTIRHIINTLSHLNKVAATISTGDVGPAIYLPTNDALAGLAKSIMRIDKNNQMLAEAADAIGKGNFEVEVKPRSQNDVLGNAVVRMKNELSTYHLQNEQKLWIHHGLEKINEAVRGGKEINVLASNVLSVMADHLQVNVGVMYVKMNQHLEYAAGYAVPDSNEVPLHIALGETLVGQAATKKQPVVLNDVPEDYLRIKTGTGHTAARHLFLIPLVHNDEVEGVVELASLVPFTQLEIDFATQVNSSIAVALQTTKSRLRLQELLEQTQAQAEELQAQHAELEQVNAEMEAQTEKLQASEEELKVQQEELLQANQELEERSRLLEERNQVIVEKNIDIQKKAEELQLSTRYKSEFLANMSHELRTPLNSVLLLSRLLAENNEKNLSTEQVEYANVIQSSGKGLLNLIDEILDLSKIEAGKMELEYQPVMLKEIVEDMRSLFAPMAKDRGIDLIINTGNDLPSQLDTDKLRLEQVLRNLLSNAIKFTAKGSVELNITTMRDNANFISFAVKDTGIGIPEEKLGLIFEAFQQADGSTRRKYGGTGLGLSISREITRLLGGEIKVTSEPGKGSEFTIYIPIKKLVNKDQQPFTPEAKPLAPLPLDEPTVQPAHEPVFRINEIPESIPDDRNAIADGDKCILIVEDDTAFAKALLDYTRQRGYKGLVTVRGDEGIELAKTYKPLGILLDIQLPVKDGWEVMEELKNNPATRHIPVHIMSSINAKKESLVKGAVDFINKPVAFEQMQEVFKKIEHVLSKDPKKVLIVEENPKHAKALSYFLETFNINTQISDSVNKGVDALNVEGVDCVILDMGIPDPKGYDMLEGVKKKPGLENLPIIIFTGRNLSKTEEARIRQYADSIVIKTAHSYQRIIDEVSLFLHLMEEKNAASSPVKFRRLGALNEVLEGKKVLVVDDDVRNIFSLTKALELHNMQVITAVDGKEALQRLSEHANTDIVLMDIMMPEMDGYQAMQAIRKKHQFRNLPIIAVTAKAMTGDREKCIKAGASDYISKPVDIDQLLSLLRVWLYDKSM